MNIAVKFRKDVPNPQRLPDYWPAQCVEIGEATEHEDGSWTIMSTEAYNAYKAEHQAAFDLWWATDWSLWEKTKHVLGF